MPAPAPPFVTDSGQPPDLRTSCPASLLEWVENTMNLQLDHASQVVKRRSIGAATTTGTWVRVEVRHRTKLHGQQPDGTEAAASLTGIAKPAWHRGFTASTGTGDLLWRADETDLVHSPPIRPGGVLTEMPDLSAAWWQTLNTSLDNVQRSATRRVAVLHTEPITQDRVQRAVSSVFPDIGTLILHDWRPAHADMSWANITAPECWILDWEDWGMAPRGLDAAMLWANSLAVPELAEAIRRHRRADLDSHTGRVMALYFCAEILTQAAAVPEIMRQAAHVHAAQLRESLVEC